MTGHPIFVFGSNTIGAHGRGAALTARRYFCAEVGVGEGLRGQSYALPTKDADLRTLPVPAIHAAVARFLAFASEHPSLRFEVTRVGCGLADDDVRPAFAMHPPNVFLPYLWRIALGATTVPRVIVAGSRAFEDYAFLASRLDTLLAKLPERPEIISGAARGADQLGERYASERGLKVRKMHAEWDRFGKPAGMLRNARMAWGSSHLVAF